MNQYKRFFEEDPSKNLIQNYIIIVNDENRRGVAIRYTSKEDALRVVNIYQRAIGKNYDLYLSLNINLYHVNTNNIKQELLLKDVKNTKFLNNIKINTLKDILKIKDSLK